MKNTCAIIIPAFNESDNLPILLGDIYSLYPHMLVVVVDDSRDETYVQTLKNCSRYRNMTKFIHRHKKSGRGNAVLAGIRFALCYESIKYCIEMDADLTHDPQDIGKFLSLSKEVDLIIGSRYKRESRIENWPLRRLFLSIIINHLLNLWLGLNISDYTDGFRLYSRRAAEFLIRAPLKESGFIALSEWAYTLKAAGYSVGEVPIVFRDRLHGSSSADLREHMAALLGAIRIRLGLSRVISTAKHDE